MYLPSQCLSTPGLTQGIASQLTLLEILFLLISGLTEHQPATNMASVTTEVAVVTGSNKGIGLAIVRRLCKEFKGDVFLTARNEENGRRAVVTLEAEGLQPKFHQLDIDSTESIEALKQFLLANYGGLDVLVNNAGIAYKQASTVPFLEQARNTLKTNFTGTVNACKALLPIIRPHGRVVNVSSSVGRLGILQKHLQEKFTSPSLTEEELAGLVDQFLQGVADGNHTDKGWANTAYGTSKIAMTALTKIHSREMAQKEDILVNACCPGWVKTDMAGDRAPLTPDQGAETPAYLALLPAGSPTGQIWKNKHVADWMNMRIHDA